MAVALLVMAASFDAAAAQQLQCSGAQKPWVVADLLFARNHVSEAGFARFLATEVTPRFPDGFTVIDAKGQWRAPGSDRISKERTQAADDRHAAGRRQRCPARPDRRGLQDPLQAAVGRADHPAGLRVVLALRMPNPLPTFSSVSKMEAGSWTVSSSLRLTGKTSRSSPRISRTPWSRPRTSAGDRREKRLVIALNRFDWEAANDVTPQFRRRRAALRFERVSACKCRNCTPVEKDQVLNLLAVSFEADRPARRRHHADVLGRRCASPRGRMPRGRTGRSRARPGAPNAARPIPISSWTAKPSKHPNRVDAPSGAGH